MTIVQKLSDDQLQEVVTAWVRVTRFPSTVEAWRAWPPDDGFLFAQGFAAAKGWI
jgi:hypothetical protein